MSTWPEVTLSDICEFKYGKSLPAGRRVEGEFAVYGSNGIVGSHIDSITDGPTIVVGRKGSFGEVNFSDSKCWPIDTTYYIDSSATDADLRWLFHRLSSLGLTRLNRAAAIPGLNREDAYRKKLLLPPIEEQRRIAAILDHADALRAKRREALARLDELTQSIFIDMFGDPATNPKNLELVTIGELLDSAQYGTSEKSGAEGEFAVLRMNNITYQGQIDLTDLKYTDLPDDKIERFTVRVGDVLFNRTNSPELVGKTAVYRGQHPMAYAGYLVRLRVASGNSPEYISTFLNSRYGKAVLRGMCKSIVGMANINAREVQSIRIPRASASAQKQFEQRVMLVESSKSNHRAALTQLDSLFASLQSRAFRGEL
ncbi:restriction endonuclease subunit S [Nocardia farcinica]|uniref:restriction endonuclease subunit S n=1 Tax=Nocardia farcinica TaxID=37329 RepID=UPI002456EC9F|nr:restriction endonuclease subunit S [Nocardia farcinica]